MRYLLVLMLCLCSSICLADDDKVARGKKLAQELMFDEALVILKDIDYETLENPQELLFYRACCNFSLLNKDDALSDLWELVRREDDCPERFIRTAKLMIIDIRDLEEDTLDEIGRLMGDVSRRIDLGRVDKTVQDKEQIIIDKLDKLIEKAEEQQQQQQAMADAAAGKSGGKTKGGASPLGDSKFMDDKGDGDADTKEKFSDKSWGSLPPKEREQITQKLGAELPTHYQEAIKWYFYKLARDEGRE